MNFPGVLMYNFHLETSKQEHTPKVILCILNAQKHLSSWGQWGEG